MKEGVTYTGHHDECTCYDLEDVEGEEKSVFERLVDFSLLPMIVHPHKALENARDQYLVIQDSLEGTYHERYAEKSAEQTSDDPKQSRKDWDRAGQNIAANNDDEHRAKPVHPVLDSVLGKVRCALQGSNEHPFGRQLFEGKSQHFGLISFNWAKLTCA